MRQGTLKHSQSWSQLELGTKEHEELDLLTIIEALRSSRLSARISFFKSND